MSFSQIRRSARRSRKEEGLYFGSLIVSIVIFYVLLSLEQQDVMIFLKTMESDAIRKLMMLIPVVYVISLCFVFFLVYFTGKYQMERRSHEFGIYRLLGMSRVRIFSLLNWETLWNSSIALLIGIPISLLLTELISLGTVKAVGLGIIGHRFRVSIFGLSGTIVGFFLTQFIAAWFFSYKMSLAEPLTLLRDDPKTQHVPQQNQGLLSFFGGVLLLIAGYAVAILYIPSFSMLLTSAAILLGAAGTFAVFKGLASLIGHRIRRKSSRSTGLYIFTGRQIQEGVLHQWKALTIASLLVFLTFTFVASGLASSIGRIEKTERTVDFSVEAQPDQMRAILEKNEPLSALIGHAYPLLLDHVRHRNPNLNPEDLSQNAYRPSEEESKSLPEFDYRSLVQTFEKHASKRDSEQWDPFVRMSQSVYIIAESSFNEILRVAKQEPLNLNEHEISIYMSPQMSENRQIWDTVLAEKPNIKINGQTYTLRPKVETNNIVADRAITLMYALIVKDDLYRQIGRDMEAFRTNLLLKDELVAAQGLMQSSLEAEKLLHTSGLSFEGFLKSMGRTLFLKISNSYLTIYLGVLFLLIANTVIGLNYLTRQKKSQRRYEILLSLGASSEDLIVSGKKEIRLYFLLVIGIACISSAFGVITMFRSVIKLTESDDVRTMILITVISLIVFVAFEWLYIKIIERASKRNILLIGSIKR